MVKEIDPKTGKPEAQLRVEKLEAETASLKEQLAELQKEKEPKPPAEPPKEEPKPDDGWDGDWK